MAHGGKAGGQGEEGSVKSGGLNHRLGKWAPNSPKGYPRIYSGALRGRYLHRAVWEDVSGQKLPPGWQVHHMFGLEHFCPESLLASPACLHVSKEPRRDPYTGEFMSELAWERRYGTK